jgi:hypothetical protein
VRSRAFDRCTVAIPLATLPTHPQIVTFHTRRHGVLLDLAGLIDSPTRRPRSVPAPRAASSSPATTNRRTAPSRSCCSHERMIDRRLRPVDLAALPCFAAGQTTNGCCRTRAQKNSDWQEAYLVYWKYCQAVNRPYVSMRQVGCGAENAHTSR